MAGTIVADTLTHSTAGSVTTDYVVNGSAKAFANLNLSDFSVGDSFNQSTVADGGTGIYTINFSSSFDSTTYAAYATCLSRNSSSSQSGGLYTTDNVNPASKTASACQFGISQAGAMADITDTSSLNFGDLA